MPDKQDIAQIKSLMRDDGWEALERIREKWVTEMRAKAYTGQNAFETLRELHARQGAIEGVRAFFDHLDSIVFEK